MLGKQAAVVEFLLGKGAWVEASDAADDTALHLAARRGASSACRRARPFLLQALVTIDQRSQAQ